MAARSEARSKRSRLHGTRLGPARLALLFALFPILLCSGPVAAELCARGPFIRWREECRDKESPVPHPPFWVDAVDRPIGAYADNGGLIYRDGEGRVFRFDVDRGTGSLQRAPTPSVLAFYEARDCQGQPLLRANREILRPAFVLSDHEGIAFAAPDSEAPTLTQSYWDDAFWVCVNRTLTAWVAPPISFPFDAVEPFRLK